MTIDSDQLLILGASVRAAAQSARRSEQSVWGVDLFADEDLKAIATAEHIQRYPTGFLPALAKAPQAPWIYTGALENYPRLVHRLEGLRPLWGNGSEILKAVRDPLRLCSELSDAGISYPQTYRIPSPADRYDLPFKTEPDNWLLKPRRSAGGSGIGFLSQAASRLSRTGGHKKSVVYQKFVPGRACSAVFVGAGGKAALLGLTKQWIGCPELGTEGFTYCGSLGPVPLSDDEQRELHHIGNTLAERFRLTGLFGVDLIQPEEQTAFASRFVVIEVNPRYTASIEVLERACGFSAIRWHLLACSQGSLPDPAEIASFKATLLHAKGILFARQLAQFHESAAGYVQEQNQQSAQPQIADIPAIGTTLMPGRPIVTLFAQSTTETLTQIALLEAVSKFESVLYQTPG